MWPWPGYDNILFTNSHILLGSWDFAYTRSIFSVEYKICMSNPTVFQIFDPSYIIILLIFSENNENVLFMYCVILTNRKEGKK